MVSMDWRDKIFKKPYDAKIKRDKKERKYWEWW